MKDSQKILAVKAVLLAIFVWAVTTIVEGTQVEWVNGSLFNITTHLF